MSIPDWIKPVTDRIRHNPVTDKIEQAKEAIVAIRGFLESLPPLLEAVQTTREAAERAEAAIDAFIGKD